jgi:hypothetical protein
MRREEVRERLFEVVFPWSLSGRERREETHGSHCSESKQRDESGHGELRADGLKPTHSDAWAS